MTAPLSDALLAEIEARWSDATPSPWEAIPFPGSTAVATPINHVWACITGANTEAAQRIVAQDAEAIAHAPDDVRLLLREVRRLRAELQVLPTPDDWEEFAAQALATAIVETEWDLSDMEWGELEHLLRFEFHTQSPHRAAMDRP